MLKKVSYVHACSNDSSMIVISVQAQNLLLRDITSVCGWGPRKDSSSPEPQMLQQMMYHHCLPIDTGHC